MQKSRSSDSSDLNRHPSLSGSRQDYIDEKGEAHVKDSHAARLKQVLEEPALRSLFREFLRSNFCEENLSFWLDVQDFKRRFNTTSSAVATPTSAKGRQNGMAAMEKHQQDLIAMAFVIYNSQSPLSSLNTRERLTRKRTWHPPHHASSTSTTTSVQSSLRT